MNASRVIFGFILAGVLAFAWFGGGKSSKFKMAHKSLENSELKFSEQEQRRPNAVPIKKKKTKKVEVKPGSEKAIWLEKAVENLKVVEKCYKTRNCGYSDEDPRAHDLAVAKDVARRLNNIREQTQKWGMQAGSLEVTAIHYLKDPDGHVKEAALKLLNELGPSAESLEAALDLATSTFDATLVEGVIQHFNGYTSAADLARIDSVLQESLRSGSLMVKREISENISSLLNSNNITQYTKLLSELPANSLEYRHLYAAVEEYKLKQSGG